MNGITARKVFGQMAMVAGVQILSVVLLYRERILNRFTIAQSDFFVFVFPFLIGFVGYLLVLLIVRDVTKRNAIERLDRAVLVSVSLAAATEIVSVFIAFNRYGT
jgi:hypothetical protein